MFASLKEFARYSSKVALKALLHVFWIFPVKNNKITLLNELSLSYGDSMKYLDIYMREHYGDKYQVVFPLKEEQPNPGNGIITVKPMSLSYFKHLITSKAVITNAGGVSYLPKRKGQKFISTWHGGGPYKKTGTALYTTNWYRKETLMNARNMDYILASCRYFSEFEATSMLYNPEQCIPAGTPRNDVMFEQHPEIKKKVFEYCGISDDYRFVLFAPTFRSDANDYTSQKQQMVIDIDYHKVLEAVQKRFGGNWRFAVRLHPKLKNVDLGDDNIINLTSYPDMQELLYSAGIVITDYSSLMWDYSFTNRPCFLYAPDIEEYERTRGFYMPVSHWPFPLSHDNEELVKIIEEFDEEDYINKVNIHHEEAGSYETGKACETVIKLIGE